jgi:nucleotide-binding universal stress UspA family protein
MVTRVQTEAGSPAPSAAARAFRTILTHVSADPQEAPRLHAAAALARKLDATLFGVACETIPPATAADPTGLAGTQWMLAMQDVTRANLERAHQLFLGEAEGLESDWLALETFPTDAIARLSRAADLIVAGGQMSRRSERYRSVDAGELMLRSGRPVLVTPPTGGELQARAVVVAWKDTREARRALADAMPFLQSAEEVLVLDVCHEAETVDADARTAAVVESLARHGVAARARTIVAPGHRVAAELNLAAGEVGADLIVAGGYGHSRLGEWVFGGVTYDLLHAQERFLLLSH